MNMENHNHGLHNQHAGRAKRTPSVSTEPLVTDFSALPSSPVSDLVMRIRYCVGNPSAWNGCDQVKSELFLEAVIAITTLSTHNDELEREVKRLREAQFWRGMDSAPKAGERILLAWKPVGGLSEHVELGKWKYLQGWSNTYGRAFSEAPDAWAPLAPFSTSPQGGEHE